MAQMKEQNKIAEKELNEMEITNLSDAEFKTQQQHKGRNEDYTK